MVVCCAPVAPSGFLVVHPRVGPKVVGTGTEVDSRGVWLAPEAYGVVDDLFDDTQGCLAELYCAVCERPQLLYCGDDSLWVGEVRSPWGERPACGHSYVGELMLRQ